MPYPVAACRSRVFYPQAAAGVTLLLDETGLGSARYAFSVRLLRAAYAGDCMRLRRSSDNAEDNVQFDASDEFSLTSPMDGGGTLADWVTTDDAFVVTWYDQSGNANDVTQSTAANQPQIISAGAILTGSNGKARLDFDGSNDALSSGAVTRSQPYTDSMVIYQDTYTAGRYFVDGSGNVGVIYQQPSTPTLRMYAGGFAPDNSDLAIDTWGLFTAIFNGASSLSQVNAGTDSTGDSSIGAPGTLVLGNAAVAGAPVDGWFQEFVEWPSALDSTARSTQRANVNAYFSLY